MAYWLVKSEPDAFSWAQQVLNRVGKAERLQTKKNRGAIKAGRGKVRLD